MGLERIVRGRKGEKGLWVVGKARARGGSGVGGWGVVGVSSGWGGVRLGAGLVLVEKGEDGVNWGIFGDTGNGS